MPEQLDGPEGQSSDEDLKFMAKQESELQFVEPLGEIDQGENEPEY